MKSPRRNLTAIRSRVLPRISEAKKVVSYQGKNITDFPKINNLDTINELNISYNNIKSLKGMKEMPNLHTLNMDSSGITSFDGAIRQPKLISVHFQGTQLAHADHIKLMAIIAFGTNVERVNHYRVQKEDLDIAERIGDVIRIFIQDGWLILGLDPLFLINPKTRERKRIYLPETDTKTTEKKKPKSVIKKIRSPLPNKSKLKIKHTPTENTEIMTTPHNTNEKEKNSSIQPSPIQKAPQQNPSPIFTSPEEVENEKVSNPTPTKETVKEEEKPIGNDVLINDPTPKEKEKEIEIEMKKTEEEDENSQTDEELKDEILLPQNEIPSTPVHLSSDDSIPDFDEVASPIKLSSTRRGPRRRQAPNSPLIGSPLASDSSFGSVSELPTFQWPKKRIPRRSIVNLQMEDKSDSSFDVTDLGLPDYPDNNSD